MFRPKTSPVTVKPKTSPVRVKPNTKTDKLVAEYSAKHLAQAFRLDGVLLPIGPRPMEMYALKLAREQQNNRAGAPDEANYPDEEHILNGVFSLLDSVDDESHLNQRPKTPKPSC